MNPVTPETFQPAPTPTKTWLRRTVVASFMLHLVVAILASWQHAPRLPVRPEVINIEIAPPPPKAEALPKEVAAVEPEQLANQQTPVPATVPVPAIDEQSTPEPGAGLDAAPAIIDARPDARPRPKRRPDARWPLDASVFDATQIISDANPSDAMALAAVATDGGSAITTDAGTVATTLQDASAATGAGSGQGSADGSALVSALAGSATGSATASTAIGSSAVGQAGSENLAAVVGAATTAGTAANLIKYFPKGHSVTALVRFDRLRGSKWQALAEKIFASMPDYRVLFGSADANISQRIDMLVISTPAPRDATATTLVAKTKMSRPALRTFLEQPNAPVTWSATQGGMMGVRGGDRRASNDKRIFFSPFINWFLLVQPEDVADLTTPAAGDIDRAIAIAKGKLKGWLSKIRSIEAESGDSAGPALVVTMEIAAQTITIPDIGIGVTSIIAPSRSTLAMELVPGGWLARGNLKFSTEAEAAQFVNSVSALQQRVSDSRVLQRVLQNTKALNAFKGLSLAQSADRVSYATSVSIADAEFLLDFAAKLVNQYFGAGRGGRP
jgi:hypothetical protein